MSIAAGTGLVVGAGTHLDTHAAALCDARGRALAQLQVPADPVGYYDRSPAAAEERCPLDDTLAAWAASVRLPDAAASASISGSSGDRRPPVSGSEGRPDLMAGLHRRFAARMITSTRPVPWAA